MASFFDDACFTIDKAQEGDRGLADKRLALNEKITLGRQSMAVSLEWMGSQWRVAGCGGRWLWGDG